MKGEGREGCWRRGVSSATVCGGRHWIPAVLATLSHSHRDGSVMSVSYKDDSLVSVTVRMASLVSVTVRMTVWYQSQSG